MGWAAIFVNEERGVDMVYAGYFYTAFAAAMTVIRFLGDKAVKRFGRRNVVSLGALMVAAGFAMVILVNSIAAAIIGFALVGIGAANIVPQLVSFAGDIKGMTVHNIISLINAIGYSGILVGPVVIGFVAKHFGLHTSFAAISVFAMVVTLVAYRILKNTSESTNQKN